METKPATQEDVPKAGEQAAPAAPKPTAAPEPEEFPDPDEDDLDDLDDMLEDFSAVKLDQKHTQAQPVPQQPPAQPRPAASKTGTEAAPAAEEAFSEEDFAKQLQAGMADLLGELEKSPDMQAQFEDIFKQISAAAGESGELDLGDLGRGPDPEAAKVTAAAVAGASAAEDVASGAAKKPAGAAGSDAPGEASFQDTIKATMERMRNSGDQATAAASSGGGGEEDFMAEMLKSLSSGDFNPEGGDEDFSKMLMGMMEQLTNKDILYEPMKELDDKFPAWMEKNRGSTPADDLKRYESQQAVVREIVAKFEEPTYADSNQADREYIVDRMQKMQAEGSPPTDLVGDMASAQEAFGGVDDGCNQQ